MTKGFLVHRTILLALMFFCSCGKNSSPEGRMIIRVDDLEKNILEKVEQNQRAMMDSISKMREEINALKQTR